MLKKVARRVSRNRSKAVRTGAGFDATIERLEDRRLLSSVVINTVSDTASATGVTLTDAIAIAASSATPTTITFDPTVFAQSQTITLPVGGLLRLSNTAEPTTITGPASGLTISGGNYTRVFFVNAGATATISGLTVTDGNAVSTNNGDGGGIYVDAGGNLTLANVTISNSTGIPGSHGGGLANYGTAALNNVTVSGNTVTALSNNAFSGQGGGIYNDGTMLMQGGVVSGNTSGLGGGGIFNASQLTLNDVSILSNTAEQAFGGGLQNQGLVNGNAAAHLTDVTVSGNTAASGSAGGIGSDLAGSTSGGTTSISLTNVTVTGNSAAQVGGGVWLDANITSSSLSGVTISGNSAASDGGGLYDAAGLGVTVGNTIVAGNSITGSGSTGPDVSGAIQSLGHNLIGETDGSSGWTGSDLTGTTASPLNARLGSLTDNGGGTQTLLPLEGSPALGAGSVALIPAGITTDQRGLPRTFDGAVDIGAVEVQSVVTAAGASTSTLTASANIFTVGNHCYLTCTVTPQSGAGPVPTGTITVFEDGTAKNTATLSNGSAVVTWTATTAGPTTLDFGYSGDGNYSPSTSNTISQTYLPLSQLSPTLKKAVLPAANVAGQPLNARVLVSFTNTGLVLAGTYTVALYADSSAGGFSGNQIALESVPRVASLRADRSLTLSLLARNLPATLPAGTYYLLVEVTDPLGNNNIVNTTQTITVSAPFVSFAAGVAAVRPVAVAINRFGSTVVTITNTGNVSATGSLILTLSPSLDGVSAIPNVALATLTRRVTIKPGRSEKYVIRFKITAALAAGVYYPFVAVSLDGVTATAVGPVSFTAA